MALIPNIGIWARNPFLYELGSTTVPELVWGQIEGMSVIERGAFLWAKYGWTGFFQGAKAAGQFGTTAWSGLTPGAWLSIILGVDGADRTLTPDCPE